ncbi:MAG TPA: histidine kinase dimerization/phosphoacceptor domain -containing protein [Allosphingosinicella sp.]
MTKKQTGWFGARFARLSTGAKMLLILSLALLPLGLIAVLASLQSAKQNSADRREETLSRLEIKAQRINAALSRATITIDTAAAAIAVAPLRSRICETTLARLEQGPAHGRYALFGAGGRPACASSGMRLPPETAPAAGNATTAELLPDGSALRLTVFGTEGRIQGVAEFPRAMLSELSFIPGTSRNFDLELVQSGRRMVLRDGYDGGAFMQTVRGSAPVASGQMRLNIALSAVPISALGVLTILLPVLMWLAAAFVGWLVTDRLLLRPLVRMQRAVSSYQPGDTALDIPRLWSPAQEIEALAQAFDQVARTVARHEADLEAAVERQTRLVREVHHRVKNNLQVVASLLNLHARGAASEDVASAYASIQRRVDALAVVHRNHYAELEENRGVALKPLISELAANLRATAPNVASNMAIRLDLEPYYVTQDVAVSVAFLITELVEFAMFCGAQNVTISLTDGETDGTAGLVIESESLRADIPCDENLSDRFERIVTGLSRQLRSAITRDQDSGRYALAIAVVGKADLS